MKRILLAALMLLLILPASSCRRGARPSADAVSSASSSETVQPAATETMTSKSPAPVPEVSESVQDSAAPSVSEAAGEVWSGEWRRVVTGRFDSSTLVITNETKESFDFEIEAFSGANMGYASGSAAITGQTARYHNSDTGAELAFNLLDGIIKLTANDVANEQNGMGVFFDGDYSKEPQPEATLVTLGYLPGPEQDDAFRVMTGKDYELFLDTAQYNAEAQDLDGFGARVFRWWVRGLAATNASIILFLPEGTICAAVIDPEAGVVKVFTNDERIGTVPKTVLDWAEGFSEIATKMEFINTAQN